MSYSVNSRPVIIYSDSCKKICLNRRFISKFRQKCIENNHATNDGHYLDSILKNDTFLLHAWLEKSQKTLSILNSESAQINNQISKLKQQINHEKEQIFNLEKNLSRLDKNHEKLFDKALLNSDSYLNTRLKIKHILDDLNMFLSAYADFNPSKYQFNLPHLNNLFYNLAKEFRTVTAQTNKFLDNPDPYLVFCKEITTILNVKISDSSQITDLQIQDLLSKLDPIEVRSIIESCHALAVSQIPFVPKINFSHTKQILKLTNRSKKRLPHILVFAGFDNDICKNISKPGSINSYIDSLSGILLLEQNMRILNNITSSRLSDAVFSVSCFLEYIETEKKIDNFHVSSDLQIRLELLQEKLQKIRKRSESIHKLREYVLFELKDREFAYYCKSSIIADHIRVKEFSDYIQKNQINNEDAKQIWKDYALTPTRIYSTQNDLLEQEKRINAFLVQSKKLFGYYLPNHFTLQKNFLHQMKKLSLVYLECERLGIMEIESHFNSQNFRDEQSYTSSSFDGIYRISFSGRGKFRILLSVQDPKLPQILFIGSANDCHRIIDDLINKSKIPRNGNCKIDNPFYSLRAI